MSREAEGHGVGMGSVDHLTRDDSARGLDAESNVTSAVRRLAW